METGAASAHTLVGAYAMDAVSDSDRAGFEQHLAECRSCREEIRELREATARLAVAAAVVPRPELKARALQAVTHIRQLPPVSGEAGATAPGAQSRQRGRRQQQALKAPTDAYGRPDAG
jgi:anti-sigma factor RsiW